MVEKNDIEDGKEIRKGKVVFRFICWDYINQNDQQMGFGSFSDKLFFESGQLRIASFLVHAIFDFSQFGSTQRVLSFVFKKLSPNFY